MARYNAVYRKDFLSSTNERVPVFSVLNNSLHFKRLVNNHFDCTFANPYFFAWKWGVIGFHIVSYMIVDDTSTIGQDKDLQSNLEREKWPTGSLYDDETQIVKVAYTASVHRTISLGQMLSDTQVYSHHESRVSLPMANP